MKRFITALFSLFLLPNLAYSQYGDIVYETPTFLAGVGISYHTTDIRNFEDSYDTDAWVIYNIDFALKVWQISNDFSLWGQLSFSGGPIEYEETISGTSFTRTWTQSFVNYGGRIAYTTNDKSMSWIGFGAGDGQGASKVKSSGKTNTNTISSVGTDAYFELGASQYLFDEYYLYFIWRGVSQDLADSGQEAFSAGGQHFVIGVGYVF